MELSQRIDKMEDELTILKNEVKSTLLDIREHVLSNEKNPFRLIDLSTSPKKGGEERRELVTAITTSVDNVGKGQVIEQNPSEQKRVREDTEGSEMEDIPGTSQLKAQMEQLEREIEALRQEREAAHPLTPPGEEGQPAAPILSSQGAQAAPAFSPTREYYHPLERDSSAPRPSQRSTDIPSAKQRIAHPDEVVHVEQEGLPERDLLVEGTQVNLLTLVGLVRWVETSIKKIGKERVEAIVEIYGTAGHHFPTSYKETIAQIIRLAEGENPEGPVTMGDSISVLLQLDSLLEGKFKTESAALSTLFGDEGGYPWTKQ